MLLLCGKLVKLTEMGRLGDLNKATVFFHEYFYLFIFIYLLFILSFVLYRYQSPTHTVHRHSRPSSLQ